MNRKLSKKNIVFLIIFLIAICASGCKSRSAESVSGTGFYFDTVVSFTVYGTDDRQIINDLMTECSRYEKIFSPTDKESDLYRLNHRETDEVSEDLYNCITYANEYCRLLDGRYDISIRPVSELWNFQDGKNEVPAVGEIENGLQNVNFQNIGLIGRIGDENKCRIHLEEGMMLDLGSAAKGYIGDKLCEYLKERGYESAIVSLGGNIQCLGGKANDKDVTEGFKVAVKSPFENADDEKGSMKSQNYADVLIVSDMSVITSGIYERCFESNGVLYHHILDAKTGYPVDSELASVTILCKSGSEADILSTVCFIAGYEKTLELMDKIAVINGNQAFEAEFIYKDGSVKRTEGFEKYILK